MKSQIRAAESMNCSVNDIEVSCIDECQFHRRSMRQGVSEIWSFEDDHRIADCYTVVSGKYYYPWTWHEPWYKKGSIEHVLLELGAGL